VNRIVVVTGTPGVGKSTVISRAVEKFRSAGADCEVINYGDFMLNIAKKKAGVTDRDEMRKLSFDIYQEIQKEAADDIARVAERKLVLLDTHCTVKKPEGYYPGLPRWVLERLRPVTIVVIDAPPAEVLGRRTKDAKRRRDQGSVSRRCFQRLGGYSVNKIVVVTGTPGVGKSTVISRAVEKLRSAGTDCEVINYGDFMLEIAKEKAGVTDRDEMRKLSFDLYQNIQKEAADDIARVAERKLVLVDTHTTVKKPEGYYPGLPRWVLERLRPMTIVIIEAPPTEILSRRGKDVERRRDKELVEIGEHKFDDNHIVSYRFTGDEELLAEIEEHQQLNRAIAMAYAAFTGAAVRIIVNKDGKLSDAVREMVEALR